MVYFSCPEVLLGKYGEAESNIMKLKSLETPVLHGVDVETMKFHTDMKKRRFDRIVFNFPHAGFRGREDQIHMIKYVHHLVMFILVFINVGIKSLNENVLLLAILPVD